MLLGITPGRQLPTIHANAYRLPRNVPAKNRHTQQSDSLFAVRPERPIAANNAAVLLKEHKPDRQTTDNLRYI